MLGGLSFEYNSLLTKLTYKKKMPSLEEFFTMMVVGEQQLYCMHNIDPHIIKDNYMKTEMASDSLLGNQQFSSNLLQWKILMCKWKHQVDLVIR